MNSHPKQRFVIIDGNAIIHRAYHALPPMSNKDGVLVHAVYGFASMLLKVIHDLEPTHLAVSFDVSGKTFRDDLYKEYKATRVKTDQALYDQIPLVHELVEAFQIPIYTKQGFEADDVIGTITQKLKAKAANEASEAIIVTGDMDILQLVDEYTRVYELRKGMSDIVMFDPEKVKERYGFGPEHVVDYKALRGDPSDNIPGIKGIGEKTATELIQKFGSIEEMYEKIINHKSEIINQVKPSVFKKLEEGKGDAEMSKKLATIERDVPGLDFSLEKCEWRLKDREKIVQAFQKFAFPSLLKRLPGAEGDAPAESKSPVKKQSKRTTNQLVAVDTENVQKFFAVLDAEATFTIKELLSGTEVLLSEFTGLVIHAGASLYHVTFSAIDARQKAALFTLLTDGKHVLVGHDLKQLVKAFQLSGVETSNMRLFDIMIASYIMDSSTRAHDLKSIVLRELGKELPAGADQTSLFGVSPTLIAEELVLMSELYSIYVEALNGREDVGLFEKIEMKLIPVLAEMELNGVAVDTALLKKLSVEVAKAIDSVTKNIWKEAGVEFNVASSQQLRDVLFDTMQLPMQGIKKGKTGFSTAASELEKLRGLHPIIEMIEEHRELSKLQNTYIDVLPTFINKNTGRIHTTFNQTVAATGRLSSLDPNLQNIPIRTEFGKKIRDAFIAEPGNVLITADYSQIELRIVASLAQDERMIQVFKNGEDIHAATAAAINGVPLDKVTKQMRYAAKEVNFGVLYGMGAFGLASRTGISQAEAKEFIAKYFSEFAGVKKYVDQTLVFAKKEGYVETLFGRRRYIPELKADNFQIRAAGERMAVNMPIQGTAADLMKLAMIAVHENIKTLKHENSEVKMLLQVHDELVLEVKKGLEDDVAALVKKTMEEVVELRVPVEVHVAIGTRWGEMK